MHCTYIQWSPYSSDYINNSHIYQQTTHALDIVPISAMYFGPDLSTPAISAIHLYQQKISDSTANHLLPLHCISGPSQTNFEAHRRP